MKAFNIVDCKDEKIVCVWNSNINRVGGKLGRTENNNALLKCPPVFLRDIQRKNPALTSDREIKKFVCAQVGLDFTDEYMHFGTNPFADVQALAETKKTAQMYVVEIQKSLNEIDKEKSFTRADIEPSLDEQFKLEKVPVDMQNQIKAILFNEKPKLLKLF